MIIRCFLRRVAVLLGQDNNMTLRSVSLIVEAISAFSANFLVRFSLEILLLQHCFVGAPWEKWVGTVVSQMVQGVLGLPCILWA